MDRRRVVFRAILALFCGCHHQIQRQGAQTYQLWRCAGRECIHKPTPSLSRFVAISRGAESLAYLSWGPPTTTKPRDTLSLLSCKLSTKDQSRSMHRHHVGHLARNTAEQQLWPSRVLQPVRYTALGYVARMWNQLARRCSI